LLAIRSRPSLERRGKKMNRNVPAKLQNYRHVTVGNIQNQPPRASSPWRNRAGKSVGSSWQWSGQSGSHLRSFQMGVLPEQTGSDSRRSPTEIPPQGSYSPLGEVQKYTDRAQRGSTFSSLCLSLQEVKSGSQSRLSTPFRPTPLAHIYRTCICTI
jgi:hypothetical protein